MSRQYKRVQAREERRAQRFEEQRRGDQQALAREPTRTPPVEYLREVRQELRKVAWPTRKEVTSYTVVVIVATAVLMGLVFGMDFVFGRLVFAIFGS